MTATMRDVAEQAGVSMSTASRALRGSPLISEATRAKVSAVAQQIGYRPNQAARTLRSGSSHLVGLVLNNLLNVSFHVIAEVVGRKLAHAGYQLILGTTDGEPKAEKALLEALADHGVDGVILVGTGQNAATTNQLQRDGIALVNVIRSSRDSASPTVLANDREGAYEGTRYLLELGHRRIGLVGALDTADSGRERLRGYTDALESYGLSPDPALIQRGPFTKEFGVEATQSLLAAGGMTALFAANHEAVFGVLPTLMAAGVRVPEDLSLLCYEDMPILELWQPPISVVDNGAPSIAELAVDLLLDQLAGREGSRAAARAYWVGAQLVRRGSCVPLR
ncbi:MAG: LacI family transcriptional regulator [Bifidobacteriaceae bacterium]|jgi:LacI family transcriptional regulator|nr:LacI family transcriptional regulator [Bifidobacteriaceae bacterium]